MTEQPITADFDRWWPREHHIGSADLGEAALEPRAGGRWYERDVDGAECGWGRGSRSGTCRTARRSPGTSTARCA